MHEDKTGLSVLRLLQFILQPLALGFIKTRVIALHLKQ